jgi:hypothetical protein
MAGASVEPFYGAAIRTTACNERISAVAVISSGTGAEFDRRLTGGCPAGG